MEENNIEDLLLNEDDDDSVKDPDFIPDQEAESSDSEVNEGVETRPKPTPRPSDVRTSDDEADDAVEADDVMNKKKRKRGVRNTAQWKRNIKKKARLSGKEYATAKKVVPNKECNISPCNCALKCSMHINNAQKVKLFEAYYNLSSVDAQSAFLCGAIRQFDKKHEYVAHDSKRTKSRCYYLKNEDGIDQRVCKSIFQKILVVSSGRIDRIMKNSSAHGLIVSDQRGKHEPFNKTTNESVLGVHNFINKFPKYKSHYTRKDNPNRMYLSPELTHTKMYELYKGECEGNGNEAVSAYVFRHIFKTDFNLFFHHPTSDSCKTCDIFKCKMDAAEGEEKELLRGQLEFHHRKSQSTQEMYQSDKLSVTTDDNITVITFDLMKTLPTPLLTTNIVFYKRQLWTYCLGIHDYRNKNGYMQMWHEGVASRGANEVASCLMRYLVDVPPRPHLIAWSDACGGQNRNIIIAVFWLYVVTSNHVAQDLVKVTHKFFLSGHSYNDSDKDFGIIEKKKPSQGIYIPSHWMDVVRSAKKKHPFQVTEMHPNDFQNFKSLLEFVTHRKVDSNGDKVEWLKILLIEVTKEEPFLIKFKYGHGDLEQFRTLDLTKARTKGRPTTIGNKQVDVLHPHGVPVAQAKIVDLKSLLEFIPPVYQDFYNSLHGTDDSSEDDSNTEQD